MDKWFISYTCVARVNGERKFWSAIIDEHPLAWWAHRQNESGNENSYVSYHLIFWRKLDEEDLEAHNKAEASD
jgi:hypothetical protein